MSARRLTVTFLAQARVDFEDILVYTERHWGSAQAGAYARTLRAALRTLSEFPALGRPRDELGPTMRSYPAGQHIIFYRVSADKLIVRRIVHRRQDVDDAFGL